MSSIRLQAPRTVSLPIVLGLLRAADFLLLAFFGLWLYLLLLEVRLGEQHVQQYIASSLVAAGLFVGFGNLAGHYRQRHWLAGQSRAQQGLLLWLSVLTTLMLLAFGLKISEQYSRLWAFSFFTGGSLYIAASRALLGRMLGRWAWEGRLGGRMAIYGNGEIARRFLEAGHLSHHAAVHGIYDDATLSNERQYTGLIHRGDLAALIEDCRRGAFDTVVVAMSWSEEQHVLNVARALQQLPVDVQLCPDLVGFRLLDKPLTYLHGVPVLEIAARPLKAWSGIAKRIEDLLIASLLLVITAPVFFTVALLIKLDSPGPVFFVQRRCGFNNRSFPVLKFRTMYLDAADIEGSELTRRDDPRVTPVGRVLRRYSIDELPQLINVLRGEMSIVGPRPHPFKAKAGNRPYEEVIDGFCARYRVRPGITGWAQVNGLRGTTDTEEKLIERVKHDLFYIENWSLWLDLKIIARTCLKVLDAENAY